MKLSGTALALLMSSLAVSACQEKRVVTALKPPEARLQCVAAGERPKIPSEHVIDWSAVQTVPQAKSEHERFVATLRTRERIVAGYLIQLEGRLFACSNNVTWLREYFEKLD